MREVAQAAREATATAFVKQTRAKTHEERVAEHFSAEDLAAAADKCSQPGCPFYLSCGNLATSCSQEEFPDARFHFKSSNLAQRGTFKGV